MKHISPCAVATALFATALLATTSPASAQQPGGWGPPQQPAPGGWGPAPQQPPPGGWGPAPQQPPQGGWGPPPGQGWGGAPGWRPAPRPRPDVRDDGEMYLLLGTAMAYGVGGGITIDAAANVRDPAVAVIAPISLGVAVPVGLFFLDREAPFHRGVAATMATGTWLGAAGGALIAGSQASFAAQSGSYWNGGAYGGLTMLGATAGALGGYAFGEWLRPKPANLTFLASGTAWGSLSGAAIGIGAATSSDDAVRGAMVGGLVGYGAGLVTAGVLTPLYRPSYYSQKWMWLGYGAGVAVTSLVYFAYLAVPNADPRRGLIANGLGGLAGAALAAVFTFDEADEDDARVFAPPFNLGFAPTEGGGAVTAAGLF